MNFTYTRAQALEQLFDWVTAHPERLDHLRHNKAELRGWLECGIILVESLTGHTITAAAELEEWATQSEANEAERLALKRDGFALRARNRRLAKLR
jgi:hypothetical protein